MHWWQGLAAKSATPPLPFDTLVTGMVLAGTAPSTARLWTGMTAIAAGAGPHFKDIQIRASFIGGGFVVTKGESQG